MRVSSVMTIILMVGLVFTIFGLVIVDMEQSYNQTSVDNSSYVGFYSDEYTAEINESATSLQKGLEEMTDEDNWFTNVGQGVIAILNAVVQVAKITFKSMVNGGKIFTQAGALFNIPTEVMVFGTVALILMIVFSLINWWHSKTPA